ncbi:DinB family protein [Streptomyces rubellomurinus]|uniref:Mini-circle protein n=1 Tax=Streptomyces rubellomurinus (strain ATCC 31215) TaxID=359131 RepID=A0A0F2TN79_STRR3|nr:DinB family protein [Streptomyces rubellomurinus]KJS63755.1 Mini-circle protein [Streptomyces rubellomurinus]
MTELAPRIDPPMVADEATMLTAWLDFHRSTLALKCQGLADDQLRLRSAPPSNLSLLGLVRHMAEVEQHWFQRVLLGTELPGGIFWTEEDEDGDFNNVDTADVAHDFAAWRAEIDAARRAAEGLPLDTVAERPRRGQEVTLRWIMVHMIEEYARHNGHADLLRELVDGSTGD